MRGLLSSEIQTGLDGVPAYPPFLKSGKLRALATNNPQRIPSLPNVPTMGELGFKNSAAPMWHALVAPAGLPKAIQEKIARSEEHTSELQSLMRISYAVFCLKKKKKKNKQTN